MAAITRRPRVVVCLAFSLAAVLSALLTTRDLAGQTADTTPPAVSITAPTSGAAVSGMVTTTAAATDNTGVAGVRFQLDGAPLGVEARVAPYALAWNTRGSKDLVFGVVKVGVGPMTIAAGSGLTKRLSVSCPGCGGEDMVSVDKIQSASGSASATFAFSTAARYVAHLATFKAANTPVFLQGASATSNTGSTTIAKAFNSAVTSGSLLVVAVAWTGNAPLTVTDSRSNVYAVATSAYDSTLGQSVAILYAAKATAGTTTVTARFGSKSPKVRRLEIHEYAGMATANPLDVISTNSANGTTAANAITTGAVTTSVIAPVSIGRHMLSAVARDGAGNQTTSVAVPVDVTDGTDSTPPAITSVAVSSITASGATINWTTDEPGTSQVNYGPTTAYGSASALDSTLVTSHTVNVSGLAGSTLYHVLVRSNDAAGNAGASSDVTFATLDGAPPLVSITSPGGGAIVSGSIPVTASATDNVGVVGVQFRLDGAALGLENTTAPYSVTWNTNGAANGSHTLTATARDGAGNQTTSAPVTLSVNNDTTPPVLLSVVTSGISASVATVTWITDEASDSQVEFGSTVAYGSATALNASLVTAHAATLTGLTDNTLYHARVRSRDAAGNLVTSGDITLTTLDGTAPAVAISAPATGTTISGTAAISASATDNVGVAGVQFAVDGVALGAEITAAPYSVSWNSVAVANGSHTLTATARDAAGNQTASAPATVTVNNDTTPPVVSNIVTSGISESGVTIAWTTNEASDSQIEFGTTAAYGSLSALDTALVTAHTISLAALTDATVYHVRVRSRDAAGNLAISSDVTFTTLDGIAPNVAVTAPADGALVSGSTTVTAAASDNVGVAGVQFAVDGANVGAEITTAPFSMTWNTGSIASGSHRLTATARDAAGNQMTSAEVTVTVSNDSTPPVLSGVMTSSITATGVTLTWITDEASDSQVEFGPTAAYGSASALDATLVTVHTVSLAGLTDGTLYHVAVLSRDGAGNLAVSGDMTVTTLDTTVPTVAITAPTAGTTLSGTATVSASATDNVGVAGVQFAVDGVNLGAEITAPPFSAPWITTGATDLLFAVVKVTTGPMTINAGTGLTRRLGVSCPSCSGDDTVSVDTVQSTAGPGAATFTFSTPAHYLAHVAAFKVATTPVYVQGATATSNTAAVNVAQSFTAPVAAGNLLVAAVAWTGTAPVTMTDSQGNTYAVAATAYDATLNQTLAILYSANARAGATTVTADFGTLSPTVRRLEIHEYSGIATTNPLDGTATNSANGTTTADAVTSGAAPTTVIGPAANGSHVLTAVARDAAGNTKTSAPITVTVFNDAMPPVVAITAPASGASVTGTVQLTATSTDDTGVAGVQFMLDGVALGAEDVTPPYAMSWNTATATNTSHTLTAVARDLAGKQTTSAAVIVTVNNDTTPPVISNVVVSSIQPSGATMTWTTNEAGSSEVEYGQTTAYGSFSTLDVTLVTAHTMSLGNLAPTTLYHFRVRSRDAAGNLAVSGDSTFTTSDGIAPVVSLTSPAAGSTVSGTVTISANATDNVGVAGVQFQLDGAPLGSEDTTAPYSIAWDTTAVTPGAHTLTAVARDGAGNRTTSAAVTVTVANSGQLTLAWDASVDPDLSGYKVYVGTSSGVYGVNPIDVGNLTTCTITGLQAGTLYYVAVTGYNQSGAEGGFSNEVSSTIH